MLTTNSAIIAILRQRALVAHAAHEKDIDCAAALLLWTPHRCLKTRDLPLLMTARWLHQYGVHTRITTLDLIERTTGPQIQCQLCSLAPDVVVHSNKGWIADLSYIGFLREFGRYFDVARMINLGRGGNFAEFSEHVVFVYTMTRLLHGGYRLFIADQQWWPSLLLGKDIIAQVFSEQISVVALFRDHCPDLWLDADLTPPLSYYQGWINTDDADLEPFLRRYTLVPEEQIVHLTRLSGAERREAKHVLAYETTALIHGADAARSAQEAADAIFSGSSDLPIEHASGIPEIVLGPERLSIADTCVAIGLCASKSEARRLAQQGGLRVNEMVITDVMQPFPDLESCLVRIGKKRIVRLRWEATP